MAASTRNPLATLPAPLRAFVATALLLTALCWGTALLAHLSGWPAPFRWPLFPRGHRFYDLVAYLDRVRLLHTTAFFTAPGLPFSYFAPGIVPYQFLYLFGKLGGFAVYLALAATALLCGAVLLRRSLVRRGLAPRAAALFVTTAVLTSFPVLFCLERGNLEVLLATGIALGLWAFCTGRPALAAVLWGTFGSVKLYPLLLFALFLHRGRLRYAALTLATAALTTLAALWYIGPTLPIAAAGIQHGTARFLADYSLTFFAQPWDHSLFALLKAPAVRAGIPLPRLLALYLPTLAVLMLALYALRIRRLPLANQILLLSLSAVLLPPTSYTYTLTELYGAFAVLTLAAAGTRVGAPQQRSLVFAMALFAAILCPFNLLAWHGEGIEGQEKCLLLLALFLLTIFRPLPGISRDTEPARSR